MLPVNWDRQNIKKEYHSPNSGMDLLYHTLFYSVTNKKIDWLYISKTKRGMEVRKLIMASILKRSTTITIVLILPYTHVPITLKMRSRPILRYFSLFDITFCYMYRISGWQLHVPLTTYNEKSTRVTCSTSCTRRRPFCYIWNAKLTETQIFRELSIEIESFLIQLESSLFQKESYLFN